MPDFQVWREWPETAEYECFSFEMKTSEIIKQIKLFQLNICRNLLKTLICIWWNIVFIANSCQRLNQYYNNSKCDLGNYLLELGLPGHPIVGDQPILGHYTLIVNNLLADGL